MLGPLNLVLRRVVSGNLELVDARGRSHRYGDGAGPTVVWEYYLAGSEAAFRYQGLVVFQVQLVKRIDALPLTRDYIAYDEQQVRERDDIDARPRMAANRPDFVRYA